MNKSISDHAWVFFIFLALTIISHQGLTQETFFSYTHPLPDAVNINPEQTIIFKVSQGFDINSIDKNLFCIEGSKSGISVCDLLLSDDKMTLIVKPVYPFQINEQVHVRTLRGLATRNGVLISPIDFHFSIINHDRNELFRRLYSIPKEPTEEEIKEINVQLPKLATNALPSDFPAPIVSSYGPADHEYYFVNLNCRLTSLPWNKFICIFDSYGTPVFFEEVEINCINFHPLQNGSLCYATNLINNSETEKYYILDDRYNLIDSVNTGNGYILDAHEMLLLNNGHFLVMSYDPQPMDMSLVVPGGNPNAIVTGLIIQEVDNNQNVFFQWRSWDHFEITDATYDVDLTHLAVDYVHGNAFEIDYDGNILLSSRHLDEITKISINSGDVMWRFGKNSENNAFLIEDDPTGFTHQHDIERLPNGHYTVFDNGNLRSPKYSQVLEYEIDQINYTARLVWSYRHTPDIYGGSAGSFRTQANGNKVIGWGGTFPNAITEINSEGYLIRDISFQDYVNSYRAIKESWETSVFSTQPELSFGNYSGYEGLKENLLFIQNNTNEAIKINSIHNHKQEFQVLTELPFQIFPYSYYILKIGFQPVQYGDYTDRLTLNYDNADTSRRIARQLDLLATYRDDIPGVWFNPPTGSSNVSPDTSILITFSESVIKAIGGEIINSDIPFLVDLKEVNSSGANVPFSGTINEEKTIMELIPDQILDINQDYYVCLKGKLLTDYDGNLISLDEECYFKTGILSHLPEQEENIVTLFPNPFSDAITVRSQVEGNKQISVYTLEGKKVYEKQHSESIITINLTDQKQGIYFIHILDIKSGASMIVKTIKSATSQ